MTKQNNDNAPWYRQPIFWMLMSGPIIVIIAAFFTFGLAKTNADDLVTDDYYKDGKHINMEIKRDEFARHNNIAAQVMFNPEGTMAKVLVSGQFNPKDELTLLLMHPAKKSLDQVVKLMPSANGEYNGKLNPLPKTVHWYVRLEDGQGLWRVESKWLPSQGMMTQLTPKEFMGSSASQPNNAW